MPVVASQEIPKTPIVQEALIAGLVYVVADMPGYQRLKCGRGFRYIDPEGATVRQKQLIQRFRALVIPPAWREVWICKLAEGHLQATGRDQKGRKQYRYHVRWHQQRNGSKFEKMRDFAYALPMLRREMEACLKSRTLSKNQVVSTVVNLLDKTLIRVGNETYVHENGSYGLTTMRDQHVAIDKSKMTFEFKGKSGVQHKVTFNDARIARIVARCQDLPGQILFQWEDENGQAHPIGSSDVNHFLQQTTGQDFSAKDFRTWHASVMALKLLKELPPPLNKTQAQRLVKQALSEVAGKLRNTVSICRKSYVHPGLIEAYEKGELVRRLEKNEREKTKRWQRQGLSADESAFLCFLERPVQKAAKTQNTKGAPKLRRMA